MRRLYIICLLLLLVGGFLVHRLNSGLFEAREESRIDLEMAYFPSGDFLKESVMGYDALAADLAWLKAVQYYGKHRLGDQLYVWLDHIFQIITDLDPHFINAYIFGALTIAQDANQPEQAMNLLQKGIHHNPDKWQLYFEKGFHYYIQLKDFRMASHYFLLASKRPEADPRCARWAAFLAQKGSDFDKSRVLWQSILDEATDEYTQKVAQKALDYLQIDYNIHYLKELNETFLTDQGRYAQSVREMIALGYLSGVPTDPLGGFYVVNPETGEVFSSIKLNESIDHICSGLKHDANRYRNDHGVYPPSVKIMQEKGYVPKKLKIPFGTSYVYDGHKGSARPIYVTPQ